MNDRDISKINFEKIVENNNEIGLYKGLTYEILDYLKNNKVATFNELIKNVGGSDRRTLRLLDQLVGLKIIKFEKENFISEGDITTPIKSNELVCKRCGGKIVNFNKKINDIMKIMKGLSKERPKPTFMFDQRPVDCETTVRRAAYMVWKRDIQNKKIAILGDDDLTSIALGLTGLAKEIIVFEIDNRLVNFIKDKSKTLGLNIKVVEQDLTKSISREYLNYFDLFMTDPTPIKVPFTIFANVGVKLLNKKKTSVGYLSFLPSCMPKSIDVQRIITRMGLLITDVIPFFTQYDFVKETYSKEDLELLRKYSNNLSEISFFEHLIRVETTKETKSIPIKYKREDLFGRATKRVLKDPKKDPAISANDEYVIGITNNILKFNKETLEV